MEMDFYISLPPWVVEKAKASPPIPSTREERMHFVIELARENVRHHTGGPFGAAIFSAGGQLLSVGINLVFTANCSVLHAEVVAIMLAQRALGRYDIGNGGKEKYELISSADPCAMCLGAIPWSGVSTLVCGAGDEKIRQIGFDEGAKPENWARKLGDRGIDVQQNVLGDEARQVLQFYAESNGEIYNAS